VTPGPEPTRPLRVASYNLRALQDDSEAAAAVVRAVDPDVLLVQEVPRHPFSAWRMRAFARQCELGWPGRTRRLAGTSVLVSPRWQAGRARDLSLPVPLLGNPRTYTVVRVGRAGGPSLGVVCVHLPLEASQRRQHVRQVLSELRYDPEVGGLPWVVGGDLNEDPSGTAWQILAGQLRVVTPLRPTFPSARPRRVIDAVFASPGLQVAEHTPVALDRDVLREATDHLPVWVDVHL
jgi:endonuclease/exonuclease/phosphatase family metal-dependent hydrolase